MIQKIPDAIHFLKSLRAKKALNAMKVLASYYYSRMNHKPYMSGLPISLAIEPTTSCNLRCPQCPSGLRSFSRSTGQLDPKQFQSLIDQLADVLCYLTFYFQGEPFLHREFLNMVTYAERKGIYTATSTNAHFLNEKTAIETVNSGLSRLIISLDGLDQHTYEQYRVGGSLEKTIAGIKNLVQAKKTLRSSKPHIILQFLVMKHNEMQARKVKAFAHTLCVNEYKLKTVQVYDFENGSDLIPEESGFARYSKLPDGKMRIKNHLYNHCWKMWHSPVVTWDGNVVPCCFDKDAKMIMGNAFQESFERIWKNENYLNFRKSLFQSRKSIDICRNCTEGTKVWI